MKIEFDTPQMLTYGERAYSGVVDLRLYATATCPKGSKVRLGNAQVVDVHHANRVLKEMYQEILRKALEDMPPLVRLE